MFLVRDFRTALRVVVALLAMSGSAHLACADNERQAAVILEAPLKLVQATTALSPPTLRFNHEGLLHAAWVEKSGLQGEVKTAQVPAGQSAATMVQVNQTGSGPEAVHQSPGFAIGSDGAQFVTWSAANKTPGALFASDLQLARSSDGQTFQTPVQVNDDGLPISHTFEHLAVGKRGEIYVTWLDGRNKDRSGTSAMLACSRDHGATVGKNVVIDGMACPCCRPMVAQAPDGSLWVAWRKTFEGNVRDIVIAHSTDQGRSFSPPTVVSRDGWVFDACPHRGPSIAFDGRGRLYIGWYTEGRDEQPRLFITTSDDQGATFSAPAPLHIASTSLPDNLQMAVHPDGQVAAVWEEVTGVRKRVVMRVSTDRGQTFGPVLTLSSGSKAEHPTVAIHDSGKVAIGWTEHAFPHNKIIVQQGQLHRVAAQ
ncbi:MAG: exo-alpha-sialidase [Nitrospira defluvii]|nr:exo-alpha-sialidase [Nitrospira defluvii]